MNKKWLKYVFITNKLIHFHEFYWISIIFNLLSTVFISVVFWWKHYERVKYAPKSCLFWRAAPELFNWLVPRSSHCEPVVKKYQRCFNFLGSFVCNILVKNFLSCIFSCSSRVFISFTEKYSFFLLSSKTDFNYFHQFFI